MGSQELLMSEAVHNCSSSPGSCSKAHKCLLKILKIISTVPPQSLGPSSLCSDLESDVKRVCNESAIDLNVGFSPLSEIDKKQPPFAAECGGVLTVECSETSKSENEIGEMKKEQGYMGLLIEAATLILGDFNENCESGREKTEETCTKQIKRKNEASYPVVRSKRGRIQVLPNKYKDSILEPLTPFSRIRSTIFATRRRSK